MDMNSFAFLRGLRMAALFALVIVAAACRPTTPAAAPPTRPRPAWAVVNGNEISRDEVEKAYRRAAPENAQPAEEEAYTAKFNLLNELIVQDLLIAKAKELKIELPESELDAAYMEAKKNIPDGAYAQELKSRNLSAADMREDLRRSLLAQKVVDKEVGEKTTPTDADVKAFFEANRAQFNRPEDAVHIAQIVVTPVREPQRTNRTGDDAGSAQEATAKAQMLMQKLKGGTRSVISPRIIRKTASPRSAAAISASCRCRRWPRRPGSCATRCSSRRPEPCSSSARAVRTPSC